MCPCCMRGLLGPEVEEVKHYHQHSLSAQSIAKMGMALTSVESPVLSQESEAVSFKQSIYSHVEFRYTSKYGRKEKDGFQRTFSISLGERENEENNESLLIGLQKRNGNLQKMFLKNFFASMYLKLDGQDKYIEAARNAFEATISYFNSVDSVLFLEENSNGKRKKRDKLYKFPLTVGVLTKYGITTISTIPTFGYLITEKEKVPFVQDNPDEVEQNNYKKGLMIFESSLAFSDQINNNPRVLVFGLKRQEVEERLLLKDEMNIDFESIYCKPIEYVKELLSDKKTVSKEFVRPRGVVLSFSPKK